MKLFKKAEKPEHRNYTNQLLNEAELAAAGESADASRSAAVEGVANLVSRALADVDVESTQAGRARIIRKMLKTAGRQLVLTGEFMALIEVDPFDLIPAGSWTFAGSNPVTAEVTINYPAITQIHHNTRLDSVIYLQWESSAVERYRGFSPVASAPVSSKLTAMAERAALHEASLPHTRLLAIPTAPVAPNGTDDPLAGLKSGIAGGGGKVVLLQTTAGAWGTGDRPQSDWKSQRLGSEVPAGLVELIKTSFDHTVASFGIPGSLFDARADGTSQREGLRRFHLAVMRPMLRMIQDELRCKLNDENLTLTSDSYPTDIVGRASALQKLVASGISLEVAKAAIGFDNL